MMNTLYQVSPAETARMNTEELRRHFVLESLMRPGQVQLTYTHYDRMIVGGLMPLQQALSLPADDQLKADYFLERREIGIINVGGPGKITVDGKEWTLNKMDALYAGKGSRSVVFSSLSPETPACYYILSAPAHSDYPVQFMRKEDASPVSMGEARTSNARQIYKYIHADGLKSCQLVMGLTLLQEGSVWNTMPAHTHDRRMEAYFYFDVPENQRVFHLMGQPRETRHLVIANYDAVLSPPWSIHAGCGTSHYGFIWGMAGENYTYTDMDPVPVTEVL